MKNISQLLIILSLITAPALGADWHSIQTGTEEDIRGLSFGDENRGLFVTFRGNLLTYQSSNSEISIDSIASGRLLEDIYASPGCFRILACGSTGIIMGSIDGGNQWLGDTLGSEKYLFKDIAFSDSLNGFIAGSINDEGILYRTEDGGKTWDSITAPGRGLSSIDISPEKIMTIAGMGYIFVSRDMGITWEKHRITPGNSVRAAAIRGKNGMMLGMSGFLALSSDTGKSWTDYPVLPDYFHCFALLMMDENRAYAIGSDGNILFTDNAGHDWIPEASGTANGLFKIQLIGRRIYCCGQKGTIIYTDLKNN